MSINRQFLGMMSLAGLSLAATLIFSAPGLAAAPKLSLPQSTHDFGVVSEDVELSHSFVIQNTGDAPLAIEYIDPDCAACTVADYDKQVPPGGQGQITLKIKPYSVLRQFTKRTKVFTNDPEQREFVLVMKGEARPIVEIKPSHIVRLRGAASDDLKGEVRFTSNLTVPWQITEYRTSLQPTDVEITVKPEVPNKVYVLEVKNKRKEGGRYAGVIELTTTSAARPRLIVRVFGDIQPSAGGSP
jgi:hypothetical protein